MPGAAASAGAKVVAATRAACAWATACPQRIVRDGIDGKARIMRQAGAAQHRARCHPCFRGRIQRRWRVRRACSRGCGAAAAIIARCANAIQAGSAWGWRMHITRLRPHRRRRWQRGGCSGPHTLVRATNRRVVFFTVSAVRCFGALTVAEQRTRPLALTADAGTSLARASMGECRRIFQVQGRQTRATALHCSGHFAMRSRTAASLPREAARLVKRALWYDQRPVDTVRNLQAVKRAPRRARRRRRFMCGLMQSCSNTSQRRRGRFDCAMELGRGRNRTLPRRRRATTGRAAKRYGVATCRRRALRRQRRRARLQRAAVAQAPCRGAASGRAAGAEGWPKRRARLQRADACSAGAVGGTLR